MTIDELFSMPIADMKQWMNKNYRHPRGYYRNQYWFCKITECFPLEITSESGWREIPIMSGFDFRERSAYDSIRYGYDKLYLAVTKISKYGECLIYAFEFTYSNRDGGLSLDKIGYNDYGGGDYCRVFIDGPDVVNNSDIAFHYELHSDDYRDEWAKKKYKNKFLDKFYSVEFKTTPVVGGVNKNKHTLNEFCEKLEKFAKNVQENGKQFYYDNKDIINDREFMDKCKKVKIPVSEVFDLWMNCYMDNQNVTVDDVIGMLRLCQSDEALIVEYRNKCKCPYLSTYRNTIKDGHGWKCYHLCLLYGLETNIQAPRFMGYLKNLEKTRTLYQSLDGYKDLVANAKETYIKEYTDIASGFENKITELYDLISSNLEKARDEYLKKTKELYEKIHSEYKGVNDADVGIFADEPDIIDKIVSDFDKLSVKLMLKIDPKYKKKEKKQNRQNKKKEDDSEFKQHCKLLFDASPELEKIVYFSVYRAYDAPYNLHQTDDDDIFENISDDTIYEYEEKYGQGSFEEWCEKMLKLIPDCGDYRDYGDDLYAGNTHNLYITRDLEYGEEQVC